MKGKVTANLETTKVLPVDLNSIILNSAVILEKFIGKEKYKSVKETLSKTIEKYMFDEEKSTYKDYWFNSRKSLSLEFVNHLHLETKHSDKFFSSDFSPLYFKNYPANVDADDRDFAMLESMKNQVINELICIFKF